MRKLIFWVLLGLCSGSIAHAQFRFVDYIPDTTLFDGDEISIDLNGDNVNDYKVLITTVQTFPDIEIIALNNDCNVSADMADQCFLVYSIDLNEKISASPFGTQIPDHFRIAYWGPSYCQDPGYLYGQTDKFIGLKLTDGTGLHYGWIQVDVASDASWITLKAFAMGDSTLRAGQTTGLNYQKYSRVLIQNTVENIRIIISKKIIIHAELINMVGGDIKLPTINNVVYINRKTFSDGIYIVRICTKEGIVTCKVFL